MIVRASIKDMPGSAVRKSHQRIVSGHGGIIPVIRADGKTIELKAGTEDNQHVVSVEPSETGKGSTFALVYLFTRGKQGDI